MPFRSKSKASERVQFPKTITAFIWNVCFSKRLFLKQLFFGTIAFRMLAFRMLAFGRLLFETIAFEHLPLDIYFGAFIFDHFRVFALWSGLPGMRFYNSPQLFFNLRDCIQF